MHHIKSCLLLIAGCFTVLSAEAQQVPVRPATREKVAPPANKKIFHLYLLAGQSNMAGRGIVEPQDTVGNPRILRLNRDGEWEVAKDPVHFDKDAAGVGPGLSFAREMIKHDKHIIIGLIPCAAGGSGMDHWVNDGFWEQSRTFPWNNAIVRTRLAMKDGTLKGILWHQGEADTAPEKAAVYAEKLTALVKRFREVFGLPGLPFVAGELPAFNKKRDVLTPQLQAAAGQLPFFAVASGLGLTPIADGVHIDAASQRVFGKRYAEKMTGLRSVAAR